MRNFNYFERQRRRGQLMKRRFTAGCPRLSLIIPLGLAIVAAAGIALLRVGPFIPYWTAGAPWQHTHLVPDHTGAHLQLDLKALNPITLDTLKDYLPPTDHAADLAEAITQFAGRYASFSTFPPQGYALIFDLRDPAAAQRYVQTQLNPAVFITAGKLVVASDPDRAALVQDYSQARDLYALRDSRAYRQSLLRQPESNAAHGNFLIHWSSLPEPAAQELALLSGCDPDAYLVGILKLNPPYRAEAVCPPLADGEPEQAPRSGHSADHRADFYLSAVFAPTPANLEAQIAKVQIPPLAQLYLLLSDLPGTPPYHDPLDAIPTPNALADTLLPALTGALTIRIVEDRLYAALEHTDPAAMAEFIAQLDRADVPTHQLTYNDRVIVLDTELPSPLAPAQQLLTPLGATPPEPAACAPAEHHLLLRASWRYLSALELAPPLAPLMPYTLCYTTRRQPAATHLSITVGPQ